MELIKGRYEEADGRKIVRDLAPQETEAPSFFIEKRG